MTAYVAIPLVNNIPGSSEPDKRDEQILSLLTIGKEYYAAGRYTESLDAYEQAIRLDPNLVKAYVGKGVALEGLKRYEEAINACEQVIRLDPNNPLGYVGKSSVLYQLKRYIESLDACEQAIRLDPNCVIAYAGKSHVLKGLGRYTESLDAYEQAIRLDPNYALSYGDSQSVALEKIRRAREELKALEKAEQLGNSK